MDVQAPVSVDEYLATAYDPDVEYVDGVLEERNVGDWLHSLIQSNIIFAIRRKYPSLYAMPELRSRTSQTRFRLPDVSIVTAAPSDARYLNQPALIAIEILSEDDRMTKVLEKLAEYESNGIPNIWLIDPRLEQMSVYAGGALVQQTARLATADAAIELLREEIFQK